MRKINVTIIGRRSVIFMSENKESVGRQKVLKFQNKNPNWEKNKEYPYNWGKKQRVSLQLGKKTKSVLTIGEKKQRVSLQLGKNKE